MDQHYISWATKHYEDLRKSNEYTRIQSNGGILETNAVGSIDGLGDCVYHPNAVTNIISLSELIKTCWVTFDSEKGLYFKLHKPNGELIRFQQSKNGLFFYDPRQKDLILLNSQYENNLNYSNEEIERAKKARNLYAMLGIQVFMILK